jgi:hypothetical protein
MLTIFEGFMPGCLIHKITSRGHTQLYASRGNLSDEELAAAKKRLMSGQDSQLAAQSSGPSLGTFFSTIGAGVCRLCHASV